MSKNSRDFSFKRFTVGQQGVAMKVGTDGVLLGAWCGVGKECRRVLDVGTGTGLVALMVAQRGEAWGVEVDAVEIDQSAARRAAENFAASPWADRLRVVNQSVQQFVERGAEVCAAYDLVVSNPPYFVDSLVSPDAARTDARHTTELTFVELWQAADRLLTESGRFAVVLPWQQEVAFRELGQALGFAAERVTEVIPKPDSPPKRVLMEFLRCGKAGVQAERSQIVIESGGRHQYSEEYVELTRQFYLKF